MKTTLAEAARYRVPELHRPNEWEIASQSILGVPFLDVNSLTTQYVLGTEVYTSVSA
jgi:hypothetical protein